MQCAQGTVLHVSDCEFTEPFIDFEALLSKYWFAVIQVLEQVLESWMLTWVHLC